MRTIDIKTLSRLLHCSRRTALNLVLTGQVPAHRAGQGKTGRWEVYTDDLPIDRLVELKREKGKWRGAK